MKHPYVACTAHYPKSLGSITRHCFCSVAAYKMGSHLYDDHGMAIGSLVCGSIAVSETMIGWVVNAREEPSVNPQGKDLF
jgi:hypothetical protein